MTMRTAAGSCPLTPALLKLVAVVDEENGVLRQQQFMLHAGFTDRKNHALREVMMAQRHDGGRWRSADVQSLLEHLSSILTENARLLKLHIEAAGEVSDIIVSGLRDADSDGTYSRRGGQR